MDSLLSVRDLVKHFDTSRGTVHAVDGVSFDISPGETLGLVGESGCGKSTLGRVVNRIIAPTSGTIRFKGKEISTLSRREMRPIRRNMQFVFQDPYASLNPRSTVRRILEEPMLVQRIGNTRQRAERVEWLLQRVGLDVDATTRFPHEFSGGQRQRIGIARALAVTPELVICDEPVSALDVSIQAQVLNLLAELQREMNLSYLFISHDLSVIKYISDRIMVMYLGQIVEIADHDAIISHPLHPYTQGLLAVAPIPDPKSARNRTHIMPKGDVPSLLAPPEGCRYHPRCPIAENICRSVTPRLKALSSGRTVACHMVARSFNGGLSTVDTTIGQTPK